MTGHALGALSLQPNCRRFQLMENRDRWRNRLDRRGFLRSAAAITAATIPGRYARLVQAAEFGGGGLLAPRLPHHDPAARQLIVLFLSGGLSHVDTFDHKPRLNRDSGKPVPSFGLRADETSSRPLLGSPLPFRACGQSGLMISELFPHLGGVADELCVIRSLHTDIVEHFQAVLAMHTGSATVPLPSLGAWISHGLGTFNPNLPSHVVLCEHLPYGGSQIWDSSFLPPIHQGVRIIPGPQPIPDLRPPARPALLSVRACSQSPPCIRLPGGWAAMRAASASSNSRQRRPMSSSGST